MVALRGTNSLNCLSHSCVNHGNQSQHNAMEMVHSLQTSLTMPAPGGGHVGHQITLSQINLQPHNVSLHLFNNNNTIKHEHSSSRYSTPNHNCMPSHHYRLLAQSRGECYQTSGVAGSGYMAGGAPGGQQGAPQQTMRVQPAQQQQQPQQTQQDMSKNTMPVHNFVPTQNQTPQARPQYSNYYNRTAQHGTRPTRQQQPFIAGGAATGMYPLIYPQMGIQASPYPQQRGQPYFSYMTPFNYSYATATPQNHTTSYYYPTAGNQPIQGQSLAPAPRGSSALVGPQSAPAPPAQPPAMPHPAQTPTHMHPNMAGMRPAQPKRSHRLKIIDPVTRQDILSDFPTDRQYVSGDSSERQTPQPEVATAPTGNSIAEEFSRMVNEVANQPSDSNAKSNYVSKNIDNVTSSASSTQPQTKAIISPVNNNIVKSDILTVNENKSLGIDVAAEPSETPVVSAMSDSPVIVPKISSNIKQIQKNIEQSVQPLLLDTNKNIANNKQPKQNKSKQVPQNEEIEEKPIDNIIVDELVSPPPPEVHAVAPEEPEIPKDSETEKDIALFKNKPNGPMPTEVKCSSVDTTETEEIEKLQTSQTNPVTSSESLKEQVLSQQPPATSESESILALETQTAPAKPETALASPTPTELLSASIEKAAKDTLIRQEVDSKEASSAFEAQVKLTQSIVSCCTNNPDTKMKDINLNSKETDPDAANGNNTDTSIKADKEKEAVNNNEKAAKNSKNMNKKAAKNANNDAIAKESEVNDNNKDEPDHAADVEQEGTVQDDEESPAKPTEEEKPQAPPVFVPKYKYCDDQWSPLNKTGRKYYDIGLLKQIKDDPLSRNKPDIPMLETCKVVRETMAFTPISTRPINDSLFPSFAKGTGVSRTPGREVKKDGRNVMPSGKGSVKLSANQSSSSSHKPVIHVSLSLREDVKLNETENAWKPNRLKKDSITEEEYKTQDLYKKFRGILNKLTPQKFDTLMEKVKSLEINNQKRLEGVIGLVFEKAIEEPNFSEAYAAMCNKLYKLKVPADNATSPDQCVNFRALIINKCQSQFSTNEIDKKVQTLEKELNESTDPAKRRELSLMLNEENRRVRMRSVGNVRFIGELYKLKMLTSKIMVFCMNHLIDQLEEEKLECLCKLLTTIGEQVEGELKDQLDAVFKKMQEIVERKNNKISSRVRFMIQDVIELRRRRWVIKSVVDSQPKTMDQIQKEAEQQQRHIELMNSAPMSGSFRREEGGRNKRGGEGRRQNSNSAYMDNNNWKTTSSRPVTYSVDTNKLKAGNSTSKSLSTIKLAPQNSGWNYGSGTKNHTAQTTTPLQATTTTNMYSMLAENMADPIPLRGNKDTSTTSYSKGASIERSTFSSRADFMSGSGSRSGSLVVPRSLSGSHPEAEAAPVTVPAPALVPQEPLEYPQKKSVQAAMDQCLFNSDCNELALDLAVFQPQFHAGVVAEILNVSFEKSAKDMEMFKKALLTLVSGGTISAENLLAGFSEIFEFAPDSYIDIPMLYEYLGKFLAPHIEKKYITFVQILRICRSVIAANQGHLLLKAILKEMKESMGPTFVKSKWQESGVELKEWMSEDQVSKFIEENKFEFLEGSAKASEETKKILTPAEAQSKLLQLMNSDENCDCIRGWVQDNLGNSSNEEWFMRALIQAICEHALFGPDGRDVPHFSQDRMNKYSGLINEFGETKQAREANCLIGIQKLIHRLQHPQGLTLEIFQYLHEQYLISVEGFTAWENSELEPEGRGVMMKALTSFFTNIREADNEDSCSED